jgi:signal transduction histidine kinase
VVDKAGLPTDNAALEPLRSLAILDRLSVAANQTLILESVVEAGLRVFLESFDFEAGAVVLRDAPDFESRLAGRLGDLAPDIERWLADGTAMEWLADASRPQVWPPDTPSRTPDPPQTGQFLVCAPLQVEGDTLGLVALTSAQTRRLSSAELATFRQASGRLALAVRNAIHFRLVRDGRIAHPSSPSPDRDPMRVSLLYQVAKELSGQLDTDQLLDQVLALAPRLQADAAYIIIEEKDKTLHFRATTPGRNSFVGAAGRRLARRMMQNGAESWVTEHQQPLLITDTLVDSHWYHAPYLVDMDRSALCVPLHLERVEARGVWTLTDSQPGAFDADDVPLAESVAALVAVILENALLFRAQSDRSAQLALINEVSQAAASILSLDLMLNTVAKAIHRRLGYLCVSVFLVDTQAGVVTLRGQAGAYGDGTQGEPIWQQRLGEGLVGQAAQGSRTRLMNDLSNFSGYVPPGQGSKAEQLRRNASAELSVPIHLGSKVVGVLDLQSDEVDAFRPQDVAAMEILADQLSIAIENARLYDEIRQRVDELTALNKISQAITSSLDLRETLTIITDHTTHLLGVEATSVVLHDEAGGDLWFAAASGGGSEFVRGKRLAMGHGLAGWVTKHGQPVLVPDVTKDRRFFGTFDKQSGFATRSILGVPLQTKGQTIGAIEAINKKAGPFDQEDLRLLTSLAAPAATAIENARLYEDLREGMRRLGETQTQLVQSAKLAAVGELAAGVAHEINNPLTSIIGFTRLLLEDVAANEQMHHDLEMIDREAARAREIVRRLLDFARTGEPVLTPVDLNALVEDAVMLVCTRSVRTKVAVEKDMAPLPPIMLDANQIKQVIVNLLNNAVQAMPDGGRLEVGTQLVEHKLDGVRCRVAAVCIRDSGVGILPENMERIFDPFFTTKEVGQGTGLGLSVSHSIVEKHKGKIEVESAPGAGSTFTVFLPAHEARQPSQ